MSLHQEIRANIKGKLHDAQNRGDSSCIIVSGDIHKEMKLENRMPSVCSVMYQLRKAGDQVPHTTPSGNSSTIKIEYRFDPITTKKSNNARFSLLAWFRNRKFFSNSKI